jgi:hypothetical protein
LQLPIPLSPGNDDGNPDLRKYLQVVHRPGRNRSQAR